MKHRIMSDTRIPKAAKLTLPSLSNQDFSSYVIDEQISGWDQEVVTINKAVFIDNCIQLKVNKSRRYLQLPPTNVRVNKNTLSPNDYDRCLIAKN